MEVCITERRKGPPTSGGSKHGPRVNEQIRYPEVRLIRDNGGAVGVVSIDEARRMAQEEGVDLVEISPDAKPPVVKLIDYGKFKYMAQKKISEARKKQVVIDIKEIQFRPNIEKHDLEVKLKRAEQFLNDGDKVKLMMQFRGRELAHTDIGKAKFNEILTRIQQFGAVLEAEPKMMGNRLFAMVAPSKKKGP